MLNFCTLFDSNYLIYGLALYDSLKKNCTNFHLYIFAFDDKSLKILQKLHLAHTTIISLEEFEDSELIRIKPSRNVGEYCWTCTPSTILYVLKNYPVESCTYLDSDIYFFSDPKVLVDEIEQNSVLITKHNYAPQYDQTKTSGKYCVQFMTFKNNKLGLEVLQWWRNACIDWCYARFEDGKFGDQKYLDDWTTRFEGVFELQNLGGGVAPWNVAQYDFYYSDNGKIIGNEKLNGKEFELVFYHFHNLKFLDNNFVNFMCGGYKISNNDKECIYKTYLWNVNKLILEYNHLYNLIPANRLSMFNQLKRTFNPKKFYNSENIINLKKLRQWLL